jgi:hypothetical protein
MIFLVFFYNILGAEETSILLFLNKFDVIFFFHMAIFNWFITLVAPLC